MPRLNALPRIACRESDCEKCPTTSGDNYAAQRMAEKFALDLAVARTISQLAGLGGEREARQ